MSCVCRVLYVTCVVSRVWSASIYGGIRFADEDLTLPHRCGSVVMANAGSLCLSCLTVVCFLYPACSICRVYPLSSLLFRVAYSVRADSCVPHPCRTLAVPFLRHAHKAS